MRRILYLMHVPWGWIKQRPHFIAEYLSKEYHVHVLFDKSNEPKLNTSINITHNLKINTFPSLSKKLRQNRLISLINYYLKKATCILLSYFNDVIWITSPNQFAHIKHFVSSQKIVIYDNMDDLIAMYNFNNQLSILEKELCFRANLIFCSSDNLKNKLIERHKIGSQKIIVANNAINSIPSKEIVLPDSIISKFNNSNKKLVYVGTVSDWFDMESIQAIINETENLSIYIIGPCEIKIPAHPRIIYIPPINHDLVFPVLCHGDALIMPFLLNELILGVNPVKAYEYISTGKPVILKKYPETEKFNEFVYLYESTEELLSYCKLIETGNLKSLKKLSECIAYANDNTWEKRVSLISKNLNSL